MRVRLIKDWEWPNLSRQTPGETGIWEDWSFDLQGDSDCDFAIVLNKTPESMWIRCPPDRVWAVIQEPPNEDQKLLHQGDPKFRRIYTTDENLTGKRYIHMQPALPWHINKTYDELIKCGPGDKPSRLSWITSRKNYNQGHRRRMQFLKKLEESDLSFDLYGKQDRFIQDKFDGLYPYQYSIAFENFQNPFYWSEKIADCFLSWTMPIYFGCTRIHEYFPSESFVQIDINNPNIISQIQEVVVSDRWRKNLDAIAYAREKILNEYQFYPMMVNQFKQYLGKQKPGSSPEYSDIFLSDRPLTRWVLQKKYLETKKSVYRLYQALRSRFVRLG